MNTNGCPQPSEMSTVTKKAASNKTINDHKNKWEITAVVNVSKHVHDVTGTYKGRFS